MCRFSAEAPLSAVLFKSSRVKLSMKQECDGFLCQVYAVRIEAVGMAVSSGA